MSAVTARAARILAALIVAAAGAAGCAGSSQPPTVIVVVPWSQGTAEYKAFLTVVKHWKLARSVKVTPESSRAPVQQLDADLAAKVPPDLVDLPNPVTVLHYKGNHLKPLGVDLSSYDQPWRGLAELGTGTVYSVPVKADVKSLLWFRAGSPPGTWAGLQQLSRHGTPWCLGLASGSASGWPGADWVADILLSRYEAATYQSWLGGQLPWTSPEVTYAWNAWGQLMRGGAAVHGGAKGALQTAFDNYPAEIASRTCEFEHGALSATGLPSVDGYDYARFPSISGKPAPVLVSGDFFARFTNNKNAASLLAYLASPAAQKLWVNQPGGYAFSASQAVPPDAYKTRVQREIAGLLQPASGTMLCFGAGDMLQSDVSTAFDQAVLDYVNNPAVLRALLTGIQQTQVGAHPSPLARSACARP